MSRNLEVKGIITPVLTPMNPDETVNLEVLKAQIDRLIENGVDGILCLGTTGEGYILSEREKIDVIEATVNHVAGRVPVYAGTGCISTADTIGLSRKAQELGADALAVITPGFSSASQTELYNHYSEVAEHVGIPIILYNIPARTGNNLMPETVARLAADVDTIIGIKDSSGKWDNLKDYLEKTRNLKKKFYVLSGNDSLILRCLIHGGTGGFAGCSNVYPNVLSSIYDLFMDGKLEEAQAAQESIESFRAVFKFGNSNTIIKMAVNLLGYPVGPSRRPFNYISEEGMLALKRVLMENKEKGMC